MNNPLDPTLRELDQCGCCSGVEPETPVAAANRPGLPAISFRAGTHSQFKASLLAGLTNRERPALAGHRTREPDDFTVALLDGWATVADVLTFYSERIASESFIRTATERGSVLELARAIGYELNPGVASSALLAFTIEDAKGAPGYATIPKGTKVQSLPGPGEKAQTFETVEALEDARKEWNSIAARGAAIEKPYFGQTRLYLQGTSTNLKPGDAVLIVGDERIEKTGSENWDFRRVLSIETIPDADPEKACIVVTVNEPLGHVVPHVQPASRNAKCFVLRQRAGVFGHNAPDPRGFSDDSPWNSYIDRKQTPPQWNDFGTWSKAGDNPDELAFHLDTVYPAVVPGSWIVVAYADYNEVCLVTEAVEDSKTDFALTAKCTRLTVRGENFGEFVDQRRNVSIFMESEELSWAPAPVLTPVSGRSIPLSGIIPQPESGRRLIVKGRCPRVRLRDDVKKLSLKTDDAVYPLSPGDVLDLLAPPLDLNDRKTPQPWKLRDAAGHAGEVVAAPRDLNLLPADPTGELFFETPLFKCAENTDGYTVFELTTDLEHSYDPATMSIFANVALGTHGETVREVLGSGDARHPHQFFTLKQPPLTFTPSSVPSGGDTTLEIWVNDVRWREVPTFFGHGPNERIYVTRLADDGTVTVRFGDGRSGARLPSGTENVRAVYRKGTGIEGNVKAAQLSLLPARPLGVKEVVNPEKSAGGDDPESLDQARENAPLTVLTLDRLVSLSDYEDFARAFSGVFKALATWTWNVHSRGILVTVAGPEGAEIADNSETHAKLLKALVDYGNPLLPVAVKSYRKVLFRLTGTVRVSSERVPEKVGAAVKDALVRQFGFSARGFGRPVAISEVMAVIQNVPGVLFADIDKLHRADSTAKWNGVILAERPADGAAADTVLPAELLVLDTGSLADLEVKYA